MDKKANKDLEKLMSKEHRDSVIKSYRQDPDFEILKEHIKLMGND